MQPPDFRLFFARRLVNSIPRCFVQIPSRFLLATLRIAASLLVASFLSPPSHLQSQQPQQQSHDLELSRPVRPWEALDVTGSRAALFGNESGRL